MAEKEFAAPHEAISMSQQASYQSPGLTSKPLKHQQVLRDMNNQTDSPPSGGYYFNVAQKGKLILPTALWVLLIIAGATFLTLLASLNKTVDTLDTLVELEREKEDHQERLAASQRRHDHEKSRHDEQRHQYRSPERTGAVDDNSEARLLDSFAPLKSSWFAFPDWASLEPASRRPQAADGHSHGSDRDAKAQTPGSSGGHMSSMPTQIQSMIDDLVRLVTGSAGSGPAPEISGSFIISSSSSSDAGDDRQQEPEGIIDSILKQVMPMPDLRLEAKPKKSSQATAGNPAASAPFISAKIDNLNINLNGADDSDDEREEEEEKGEKRGERQESGNRKRPVSELSEIEDLDNLLDNLLSSVKGQKLNQDPIVMDLSSSQMIPMEVIQLDGSKDRRPSDQMSQMPLADLLRPFGFGPSVQQSEGPLPGALSQFQERPASLHQQHDLHHHIVKPGGPDQIIVSIASDEPQSFGKLPEFPSLLSNPGLSMDSDTRRGPPQGTKHFSPYDLPVGTPLSSVLDTLRDFREIGPQGKRPAYQSEPPAARPNKPLNDMEKIKEEAKWDRLAKDLAESVVDSILQEQSPSSSQASDTAERVELPAGGMQEPIILINGKPLDQSERQKFTLFSPMFQEPGTTHPPGTSRNDSNIGDLFSFFFGYPNPNKSAAPESATKDSGSVSVDSPRNEMTEKLGESLTPSDGAKINAGQSDSPQIQTKDLLGELLLPNLTSTADTKSAEQTTKEPVLETTGDQLLNDILGSMFTMTQFGGDQQQRGTSETGGSSSGSSTSSSQSPGAYDDAWDDAMESAEMDEMNRDNPLFSIIIDEPDDAPSFFPPSDSMVNLLLEPSERLEYEIVQ